MRLAVLCALLPWAGAAGPEFSCPDYATIRQPSVAADRFRIAEIQGAWYLQATTEPTTKACLCNLMNYSIGTQTYRYTDTCYEDLGAQHTWSNMSFTLGGYLSTNPQSPGTLREGFVVLNRTLAPKPNMLFDVVRDSSGELTAMRFYACLGRVLPFTKPLFSYLLYTRRVDVPEAEIRDMVQADSRLAGGALEMNGLVYTNHTAWSQCGYQVRVP